MESRPHIEDAPASGIFNDNFNPLIIYDGSPDTHIYSSPNIE